MPSPPKRKSSPLPYRWPFIRLSMHVRAGTLSDQEREQLANILLQLAYGKTPSQAIGVQRGRPVDPSRDEWVFEIAIANLPPAKGGRGLTIQQATKEQATKRNKSYETVEAAWKSLRGRAIRRAVKRNAPGGYEIGPI